MDKDKGKILLALGVLFVIVIIIALVIGNKSTKQTNGDIGDAVLSSDFELLTDKDTFFKVNNAMNNFISNVVDTPSKAISVLESNYINDNNITTSNIKSKLGLTLDSCNYYINNINYNPNSDYTYYFMNGYILCSSDGDSNYIKDVNYLMITNKNNYYEIMPISNSYNLNNYEVKAVIIPSNEKINNYSLSESNMMTYYMNNFLNYLLNDKNKAYDMLGESTKNKYGSIENLINNTSYIYSKLSNRVYGINKKEEDGIVTYSIVLVGMDTVFITEYGVMNYKIDF